MKAAPVITEEPISPSPRSRFRAAMILAMAADALQIFVFPLFAEGALSPADDVLDIAVAAVLVHLLDWHYLEAINAPEPQPLSAAPCRVPCPGPGRSPRSY